MIRPGITRQVTEPRLNKPWRLPPLTGNALTEAPALPGARELLARLAALPPARMFVRGFARGSRL
jgi:hypothetical protein